MPRKEKKALGEDPHKVIKLRFAKEETFSVLNYLYGNCGGSMPQFRLAQRGTFSLYNYWYGNW